ncbi:MAG: HAMP domain-containing protein [Nitrospirota bacterium]
MKPVGIKGKVIGLYSVFLVISLSFWIISFIVISNTIEDASFFYKRGGDIQSAARMKTDFVKEVVAISQYLLFDKEVYNDLFKTQDKKLNEHLIKLEKRHNRNEEHRELEQLRKIRERYNIFIDEILEILSHFKKNKSYAISLVDKKGIYQIQEEIYGLIDLFIRQDAEQMSSLMTKIESRRYLLRYFPYLNPLIEQIQSVFIYNNLSIRMIETDSILWNEILMLNNFWLSKKDDYLRRFYDLKELFDAELTKINFFQGYIEDYENRLDELMVTHNKFINNLKRGDNVVTGEIIDPVMRDETAAVYLLNSIMQDVDKTKNDEIRHVLMIGKSIKKMSYHSLIGVFLIFGVIMAGILFVVWPIIRRVKILDKAIRVAGEEEDLTVSVDDATKDEIGELSRSFNKMIASLKLFKDRLEERCEERTAELEDTFAELKNIYKKLNIAKSQLFQSEKMASITQLSTDMAHEIISPVFSVSNNMNVLSGYIREIKELIDRYDSGIVLDSREIEDFKKKIGYNNIFGHIKDIIAKSKEDTEKAGKIINFIKDFSDINGTETRKTNVNNDIEYALNIFMNRQKHTTKIVEVIKEYGRLPDVECNPLEIKLLFMNLLVNTSNTIKDTGEIKIKTYKNNENVVIEFSDTGKNESIYGLSVINGIVNRYNGKISVENADETWRCLTITLPVDGGNKEEGGSCEIPFCHPEWSEGSAFKWALEGNRRKKQILSSAQNDRV